MPSLSPSSRKFSALASALALSAAAGSSLGQTVVTVGAGETLTEADLIAGMFNGQQFTLGAGTTFNIEAGGAVLPFGLPAFNPNHVGDIVADRFDFLGSIFNFRNGSSLPAADILTDTTLPISFSFQNATVNFDAGSQISGLPAMIGGSVVNVRTVFDDTLGGVLQPGDITRPGSALGLWVQPAFTGSSSLNVLDGGFVPHVIVDDAGGQAQGGRIVVDGGEIERLTMGSLFSTAIVEVREGRLGSISEGEPRTSRQPFFFNEPGLELRVSGGTVDSRLEGLSGFFEVSGGQTSSLIDFRGSGLISGGEVRAEGGFWAIQGNLDLEIDGGRVVGDISSEFVDTRFVMSGGVVSGNVSAANVEVSGGRIEGSVGGPFTQISGGRFGSVIGRSRLEFIGEQFAVNGVAQQFGTLRVPNGDILSGILADGTAVILPSGPTLFGGFQAGDVVLTEQTAGISAPQTYVLTTGEAPATGLRPGDRLVTSGDASISDNFAAIGADVEINGGTVGRAFAALDSQVRISDGDVADAMLIINSDLTVEGGVFRTIPNFLSKSIRVVGLEGQRSALQFSGGEILGEVEIQNTDAAVHGGRIASVVTESSTFAMSSGVVLSMTASKSQIDLNGGELANLVASASVINLASTALGSYELLDGSALNVREGANLGPETRFEGDFSVALDGGEIGDFADFSGIEFTMESGKLGFASRFREGSNARISGGLLQNRLRLDPGAILELVVQDASLDGVAIDFGDFSLIEISERGGEVLTGYLLDGSAFRLDLRGPQITDLDGVLAGSTLRLGIPSPASAGALAIAGLGVCRRRRPAAACRRPDGA